MMLKIQRKDQKQDLTTSWIIFSEILNVDYVTIEGEFYKRMVKECVNDVPFLFDYTAIVGEPDRVVTVSATRKNGTILYVAFNTVGYLLNDEGKTIERLV